MHSIKRRLLTADLSIAFVVSTMFGLSACENMGPTLPASSNSEVLTQNQIAEIVASPDRSASDRQNDVRRKPEKILEFIGIRPGMVALDLSASGGYTTELLARAVGPTGKVYGQSAPLGPNSSVRQSIVSTTAETSAPPHRRLSSAEALAERAKNPAVSNIIPIVRRFEDPIPPEVASDGLDLVTIMFNYHDLGHMGVDRKLMNNAVFAALKPGGMYVIADHSGRPGTGISESGTLHRIEETFLRKEVESAGFILVAEGNFLRNPLDPRDQYAPEPPQPKDEFILKFIKPMAIDE